MKKKIADLKGRWSLQNFVMVIFVCFAIISEVILIGSGIYILKSKRKEESNSYKTKLDSFNGKLHQETIQIEDYMLQMIMMKKTNRSVLNNTKGDVGELEAYIENASEEELDQTELLSGILWYKKAGDSSVKVVSTQKSLPEDKKAAQWIKRNTNLFLSERSEEDYGNWFLCELGEKVPVLIYIVKNNKIYMASWISTEQIFRSVDQELSENRVRIFLKTENQMVERGGEIRRPDEEVKYGGLSDQRTENGEKILVSENTYEASAGLILLRHGERRHMPWFFIGWISKKRRGI